MGEMSTERWQGGLAMVRSGVHFFNNSKNGLFFECPPVPCIVLLTGGYSWAKTDETPSSQFPINQEATINR